MRVNFEVALAAVVCLFCTAPVFSAPVGDTFTYQGRLNHAGAAVTAPQDLEFRLFDAASDGSEIGSVNALNGVAVTHGLFTVPLNFGVGAFGSQARYLDIRVRPSGSGVAYTTLTPRQPITPAPVALSVAASGVDSAAVKDGAITRAKMSADFATTMEAHSLYVQSVFVNEPVFFHSVDKIDGYSGFGTNFSPVQSGYYVVSASITMSPLAFPGATALVYLCRNGVQTHTLGTLSVNNPLNSETWMGIVAGDQISVTTLATTPIGPKYVDVAAESQLRIVRVD